MTTVLFLVNESTIFLWVFTFPNIIKRSRKIKGLVGPCPNMLFSDHFYFPLVWPLRHDPQHTGALLFSFIFLPVFWTIFSPIPSSKIELCGEKAKWCLPPPFLVLLSKKTGRNPLRVQENIWKGNLGILSMRGLTK